MKLTCPNCAHDIEPEAIIGRLSDYGLKVEKWGDHGYTLVFDDGDGLPASLQIEGHGGVASTRKLAEAEGIRRILRGDIERI